ncbi:MAG: peptidyl-prolyl cis-trans isomerase [Vicinamibacterales bacterium]
MTMLDRMRRHRNWLKWSLALVCLAFVIFYIPDFLQNPAGALPPQNAVAVVEGQEISAIEFQRAYQSQVQAFRSAYGAQMTDRLLKQLGIDQQALMQLVDERAALAEAQRLNIGASDAEVRQRILTIPAFQENGQFIGEQRYQQMLAMQRPPLTAKEFEDSIRRAIIVDKLRSAVTEWLSVTDAELDQEYKRRNDKVKLAMITVRADAFRGAVNVTDADVSAHYEAHKQDFEVPEKRKIKYVLVDGEAIRAKITIPQADLERAYNENFDQYSTPEEIRASHILLRTEGKEETAVKAKADELLTQARAGADFAELAKANSEDEGTKANGGDLDFFPRGRMVPEFDAAAFALQPGQISDVVKTQYGFHIIKLVEKRGGTTRPLEEVRQQLTDQLTMERAQEQVQTLAQRLADQIKTPADLDAAAKANNLTVQETGFFARTEGIPVLGGAPEVAARAFTLKDGEISGSTGTARGVVFFTVTGKQDAYVPKLEEAKDRVREALISERARDLARQRAAEILPRVKIGPEFEKAAKAAGLDVTTTELLTRESPIPEVGAVPAVTEAAFKTETGTVSDVINTDNGAVIFKVLEKQEVSAEELTAQRDTFREELLGDRRGRFFSAFMVKAKQKMNIQLNQAEIQRVLG